LLIQARASISNYNYKSSITTKESNLEEIKMPKVLTPGLSLSSEPGLVTLGNKEISIANIGTSPGVVLNIPLAPGNSYSWRATGEDEVLSEVGYDASGTVFVISTLL
jgi:hypothetical protein